MAQRREREREQLRSLIVEAARDLLLEQGLNSVSMRAIAERIEYSPATIYLYFRDKDELIRAVVRTGFERLQDVVGAELAKVGETASAGDQYRAMGRAYARFGIENPSYFRIMFDLPSSAELECEHPEPNGDRGIDGLTLLVRRAVDEGEFGAIDPRRTALIGWGLVHGLTTLYLSGQLQPEVGSREAFVKLIEDAMDSIYAGWRPVTPAGEAK